MQGVRPNAKLILRCSRCFASCLEPYGVLSAQWQHRYLRTQKRTFSLVQMVARVDTVNFDAADPHYVQRAGFLWSCVICSHTASVCFCHVYTCAKGENSLDGEEKESFECRFFRAIRVTLPVWMCALPDNASIHRCRSDRSKSESPFDVRSRCAMGENYGGMSSRFQTFEHGCMCAYANAWHVRLCS